jgi:hypothetical protein
VKVDETAEDSLPTDELAEKRAMAAFLATRDYVATILWNEDELNEEGLPANPPPHKVRFVNGQQNLAERTAGFHTVKRGVTP